MSASAYPFISCTMAQAVKATGVGETRIKEAIDRGDLIAHYNGNRLVIRAADLDEWVQSLPTGRAS